MKILSVVALVSPLGEYGGPLRVAVNQSKALIDRGHSVTIAGGFLGDGRVPHDVDGVPARLFRARKVISGSGHAGLATPCLWIWMMRFAAEYDVAHIHLARDLVTMPTARISKLRNLRYVVQTHGMIDESDRLLSKPLDSALTRTVLKSAHRVLYLSVRERNDLIAVANTRSLALCELPNGVPVAEGKAGAGNGGIEILFLARLAPRKRPLMFVHMAQALSVEFPQARFTLVGPDDGEGLAVRRAVDDLRARGIAIAVEEPIPPTECIRRLSQATVYVLPAVDEPYPMSVLEAMSVGLPVVVTDSCGLASFVRSTGAGVVVGQDQDSLNDAVRMLLSNRSVANELGDRGQAAVRANRSMDAIAAMLEKVYDE